MVMTVRIHEYGGPEVLRYEDVPIGSPGEGEVLVRHRAIGLNFADLHTRSGRYPVPSLPHAIGGEACGVVEEVGPGVDYLKIGDRIAYSTGGHALPRGTYTEARVLAADRMIVLPDDISDETAACMVTKGLTAQYLLKDVYRVGADDTVLIHAAAGGVGLILSQWAKHLGARVIGVVSTDAKADLARQHGCDEIILSGETDIAARVRDLTGGEGVPVVYDAVGRDSFEASLHALRPRGMLVSYGTASGPIPPFDLFRLNEMGSLYVTSAAFYWHIRTREDVLERSAELIDVVQNGAVKIVVNQRYALADVAQAHRDMESRATSGMSVLIP